MARPIIVANWKMNPQTWREAKQLFDATRKAAERTRLPVVVAPPAVFLRSLAAAYKGRLLSFAGQDCSAELGGAHTGEISLAQLSDAGATRVIIGHSERRAAGESDEDVRAKVRAALSMRVAPIVCVGERERDSSGAHFTFVAGELRAAFLGVTEKDLARAIVAYEPVWAIGKEEGMPPQAMHEMAIFIRKILFSMHGESALSVNVLYGGAITEASARAMLNEGDVAGLLVGHVSVDTARFVALLSAVARKA